MHKREAGEKVARETLKQARKAKGMTQQQVAEYLGISLRYYQSLEARQRTGDFKIWDMLEDLLNIHQRDLREEMDYLSYQAKNRLKHREYPQ